MTWTPKPRRDEGDCAAWAGLAWTTANVFNSPSSSVRWIRRAGRPFGSVWSTRSIPRPTACDSIIWVPTPRARSNTWAPSRRSIWRGRWSC